MYHQQSQVDRRSTFIASHVKYTKHETGSFTFYKIHIRASIFICIFINNPRDGVVEPLYHKHDTAPPSSALPSVTNTTHTLAVQDRAYRLLYGPRAIFFFYSTGKVGIARFFTYTWREYVKPCKLSEYKSVREMAQNFQLSEKQSMTKLFTLIRSNVSEIII